MENTKRIKTLKDGRFMEVRLATNLDVPIIAAAHPLPRLELLPERPCRKYYEVKTWLYVNAPEAGIVTGWVSGELAGFVFFARQLKALQRHLKTPSAFWQVFKRLCLGSLTWTPRLWVKYIRWTIQHFRSGERAVQNLNSEHQFAQIEAWIGTVHTVENFRRLGVASILLDYAETELKKRGAKEAALWAATDNLAALELYEKLGYKKMECVPRIGEECWLLVKKLV